MNITTLLIFHKFLNYERSPSAKRCGLFNPSVLSRTPLTTVLGGQLPDGKTPKVSPCLQHQPHYAHTTSTNADATATSPATTTPRLLLPSRPFPFFLSFFLFFFSFISWTPALLVVVVDCCCWSGAEVCPLGYTTFLGMPLRQHREDVSA